MSDERIWGWILRGIAWVAIVATGIACLGMWGCPHYKVYEQRLHWEAKLREAESSRMILVQEATAKRESAKLLADAEVERAKGVAQANQIIGEGLKDNNEYLLYLWIQGLSDNTNNVIYIPTEANLPIMEAGRLSNFLNKKNKWVVVCLILVTL